ncbi:hypothetical protein Y032_0205g1935 [Ancylostoma ceylanicum]|uniref:Uncharacterized protein n=1 Tax=Ancylostoma ceylanicum TaxID=53326 RepID=A0A016SMD1_9BILA|nr:hypothetical protein Y032_0205g1935 [Ancylostoma ceylanicum]
MPTFRGYRVVSSSLSDDDVTVVVCSVLFFAAFFIAVFTQYRAEASVCRVLFRCWTTNRNWTIRHYDIRDQNETSIFGSIVKENVCIPLLPNGPDALSTARQRFPYCTTLGVHLGLEFMKPRPNQPCLPLVSCPIHFGVLGDTNFGVVAWFRPDMRS